MNDLSYKYKCLQKDKESAEYTINKLSNTVQEKEKEINSLIEDLAKWELKQYMHLMCTCISEQMGLCAFFILLFRANENVDREEHTASANSIQKLKDENASLKSELSQLSHE